jgi:hypothetical protein
VHEPNESLHSFIGYIRNIITSFRFTSPNVLTPGKY